MELRSKFKEIKSLGPQSQLQNSIQEPKTQVLGETEDQIENLRLLNIPKQAVNQFLRIAKGKPKEIMGIMYGDMENDKYYVRKIAIPDQIGDTTHCEVLDKGNVELDKFKEENNYILLGWIHTHPNDEALMSAIDLHNAWYQQKSFPEYVSIICSLLTKKCIAFRIVPKYFEEIKNCKKKGFHQSHGDNSFEIAKHAKIYNSDTLEVFLVNLESKKGKVKDKEKIQEIKNKDKKNRKERVGNMGKIEDNKKSKITEEKNIIYNQNEEAEQEKKKEKKEDVIKNANKKSQDPALDNTDKKEKIIQNLEEKKIEPINLKEIASNDENLKAKKDEQALIDAKEEYSKYVHRRILTDPGEYEEVKDVITSKMELKYRQDLKFVKKLEKQYENLNRKFPWYIDSKKVKWVVEAKEENIKVEMEDGTFILLTQIQAQDLKWMVNLFRCGIEMGKRIKKEEEAERERDKDMIANNEYYIAEIIDCFIPNEIDDIPMSYLVRWWNRDICDSQWTIFRDMNCWEVIGDFLRNKQTKNIEKLTDQSTYVGAQSYKAKIRDKLKNYKGNIQEENKKEIRYRKSHKGPGGQSFFKGKNTKKIIKNIKKKWKKGQHCVAQAINNYTKWHISSHEAKNLWYKSRNLQLMLKVLHDYTFNLYNVEVVRLDKPEDVNQKDKKLKDYIHTNKAFFEPGKGLIFVIYKKVIGFGHCIGVSSGKSLKEDEEALKSDMDAHIKEFAIFKLKKAKGKPQKTTIKRKTEIESLKSAFWNLPNENKTLRTEEEAIMSIDSDSSSFSFGDEIKYEKEERTIKKSKSDNDEDIDEEMEKDELFSSRIINHPK